MILLPAFIMAILMIVSHSWFGLHVLARGIVFIDLALAQVAALGASLTFLLGYDAHDNMARLFAFSATLLASLAFARLRLIKDKTAREVTIGCVYVVATALSVVILSRSAQGMDELKAIFNGNILWVSWNEILMVAAAYLLVGLFHVLFRHKFMQLSRSDDRQVSFLWEFLFFASFAVVITFAVNIAGILLVFAFLIIPAFSALILTGNFIKRYLIAVVGGLLASIAGLWVAFLADLPVGATVVSVTGILPVIATLIGWRRRVTVPAN
jgi:zinc/manganese transport system permease protein